ncbi:MAG: VIT domain-containing protein [Thermodesulfobacteriota bacterium]
MKTKRLWLPVAALLAGLLYLAAGAWAAPAQPAPDKNLCPYFFVKSEDPSTDQLPLKSTRAEVQIAGVMAQVRLIQHYRNEGQKTLEAIYIFPASTRAAVHALKMKVGPRTIEARIREREAARQEYERARRQGRSASLLEQQRPNVFQMNVANILPGDEIVVELTYSELLVPEAGVYEFVFPTVVGPRYHNPRRQEAAGREWVQNPYLRQGQDAPYTFALDLSLTSPLPISQLTCPSHQAEVRYQGRNRAQVSLAPSHQAGNRDFVLRYSLAGERIQSGLLLQSGPKENFFLLMLEPPRRLSAAQVLPREYIFVLDVSGSMHGFPLEVSKQLIADLLGGLKGHDYFNLVLFAGASSLLSPTSLPASPQNLARALALVERQRGGGGTELLTALRQALAIPAHEGVSRSVVLISDGLVTVEREAFDLVQQSLGRANFFAFGIGSSVNRFVIEGLARAGQGEAQVVLRQSEAAAKAARFRGYVSSPLLGGLKVSLDGFAAYDLEPPALPDLLASRPLVLFGKFRGRPQGKLIVRGRTAQGPYERVIDLTKEGVAVEGAVLGHLWARSRVARLADLSRLDRGGELAKQITALGLRYSLLTDFTSFVAVDIVVRADGSQAVTVRQPLPLPQGVSDAAVGSPAAGYMQAARLPSPAYLPAGRYGLDAATPRTGWGLGAGPQARAQKEAAPAIQPPRSQPAVGRVKLDRLELRGAYDSSLVLSRLAPVLPALQERFRRICGRGPLLGALSLEFGINRRGQVTGLRIKQSQLQGPAAWSLQQVRDLEKAALALLQGLRLDPHSQASDPQVTMFLDFQDR